MTGLTCVEIQNVEILNLIGGLCCAGFMTFIIVVTDARIFWAKVSGFHLKIEAEYSLRNIALNKRHYYRTCPEMMIILVYLYKPIK
jgi:hypothetical protein